MRSRTLAGNTRNSALGTSVLATLPWPLGTATNAPTDPATVSIPFPDPSAFPGSSAATGTVSRVVPTDPLLVAPGLTSGKGETISLPPASTLSSEETAAREAVSAAKFFVAYYIMSGVASQLLADAYLVPGAPAVAEALNVAGYELLTLAYFTGAAGSQDQLTAAEATLQSLLSEGDNATEPNGTAGPGRPGLPADLLDPEFIYGTWERFENVPSGMRIIYQFSPDAFRKINVTTAANGDQNVRTELLRGSVDAAVSYTLRNGTRLADTETEGAVNVTLSVARAHGGELTLAFRFFNRTLPGNASQYVEVLTELEGERKAFFKLPAGLP